MATIKLPTPKSDGSPTTIENVSSLVIVGANGSGKSRLGAWIDHGMGSPNTHRISAQRALSISEYVQPRPLEQATRLLLIGSEHPRHMWPDKYSLKWQENPTGKFINDFDIALAWLFADHSKTAVEYLQSMRANPGLEIHPPYSKLERLLAIWSKVMPQRDLILDDNKVSAKISDGQAYAGHQLSDGERVVVYLIAQCLATPRDGVIVVDEPELHLHQAIQSLLWDEIEAARPDCLFVYITHDLTFAASRTTAKKIWVRSFDGKNKWDWQEIEEIDQFPEPMVLQILGSRRPILFVEGTTGSIDIAVYESLFPERLVIPRESCSNVRHSTTALRSLPQLHHQEAFGFIDRDHRSDEEIDSYQREGVFAADVAEVESLFLLPEVVQFVSKHLKRKPIQDIDQVKAVLFDALRQELSVQINDRATFRIQQRLNSFAGVQNRKGSGTDFKAAVEEYLRPIDPIEIYSEAENLFKRILDNRNFDLLLKHYNRKSLCLQVSRKLGLGDEYPKLVVRLLKSEEGEPLRMIMRSRLPSLPT